jgi:carboxylesterase type B
VMRAMDGSLPLGPIVDGDLYPSAVADGMRAGSGRDIPLLVGSTRQEFSGLAQANRHLFEDHDIEPLLEQVGLSPEAAQRFAVALQDHHPAEVVGQYVTDVMFRRRIVDWLDLRGEAAAPTWAYDFGWPSAVSGLAEHCLDVPFIFDLLEEPDVSRVAGWSRRRHWLIKFMRHFLGSFVIRIRAGHPTISRSRSRSSTRSQPLSPKATNRLGRFATPGIDSANVSAAHRRPRRPGRPRRRSDEAVIGCSADLVRRTLRHSEAPTRRGS